MTDMRPFPLQSFEEEVRVQAEIAGAKEVLKATMAERDRIREEARREGLEKGKAEALAIARKAERERGAAELAAVRDLLEKAAEALQAKRAELVAEYVERFANPYVAAARGYIDDVIEPHETRPRLIAALRSLAGKRDTNPRKKHGNIPL
jgi:flagellar biosynthesis/type III secretory pathway protein FliH